MIPYSQVFGQLHIGSHEAGHGYPQEHDLLPTLFSVWSCTFCCALRGQSRRDRLNLQSLSNTKNMQRKEEEKQKVEKEGHGEEGSKG